MILFFLIGLLPVNGNASVRLYYSPSVPIQHTSKLAIDIQESLPILNLSSKGSQMLKFDLTAAHGQGSTYMQQPPLAVKFLLRDIFINLSVNGEEMTFDSRKEKASIPLMQLRRILDKPIRLIIDSRGCLVDETNDIKRLGQEFPALQALSLNGMLEDLLRHLFALIGKDLEEGMTYEQACKNVDDEINLFPERLTYEVKEITEKEVKALIRGQIDQKDLTLRAPLQMNQQNEKPILMTVTGALHGKISWDRKNALLYTLNTEWNYNAQLQSGEIHWPLHATVFHQITSSQL